MKIEDAATYISQSKMFGVIPNFWLSLQYLQFQENARLVQNEDMMWIEEDGVALFPPLPIKVPLDSVAGHPNVRIWSDFANYSVGEPVEFLDYEYSYRSEDFQDLRGGQWAVFRKNIRKWPARNPDWTFTMDPPYVRDIEAFITKWLAARPDAEIHDPDTLIKYVFQANCRGFFLRGKELVGMNIWDICDTRYLIYRYCIADPDEPFLDEFLRYQFYMSHPHKIVIDGGTLGNPGLERFKDRLNPFRKRNIFTKEWRVEIE